MKLIVLSPERVAWQIHSHAIPPEAAEHIFRRINNEPRKQTQNI